MFHVNRTLFNEGWRFQFEGDSAEIVTLPHTWNALDTMALDPEPHYRRGQGCYTHALPAPTSDARRFLQIDAAAMRASVWLDDELLGSHVGGYTPFTLALPPRAGTLRVEVDNRPDVDLIPSDRSDFFLYGGLTRSVWLYETGPLRVEQIHIHSELSADSAEIEATISIDGAIEAGDELELVLTDGTGQELGRVVHALTENDFRVAIDTISQPALWSPSDPHLYTLRATVRRLGRVSDIVQERFGLRTFDFPEGGPFYLNGERLLLRGTHRHEDWAGRGSAEPDEWSRREMAQIKAAGFNFVRLGHYPQADAVLDACDELGLIVWEEIPWCRGGVGGELFKSQTRQMLREMVAHHFNRPSIFFWGMGNELDWESDHPTTTDDDVLAFLRELNTLSHELDPTRLTALRRYDRGSAEVDVYSPSIWSGWYRGRYEDYEAVLLDAMQRFPRMIHTEWGGDSHVGRHNSGPHLRRAIAHLTDHAETPGVALATHGEARASLDSDWSESYILDLMEWHLQVQNRLPNLAGTAQWVFKDFGTPLRPENPIPYVNQKGLVDRSGRPKDVYFVFQAYQTNTPVCHIESPTWPIRTGEPGALKRVRVYSNCERVELFVNGQSQGTKFPNPQISPAGGLVWFVPLQLGRNQIRAEAMTTTGTLIEHAITQTLVPNGVTTAEGLQGEMVAWDSAVVARVQLVSANGIPVIRDERRITFSLSGAGRLLRHQGTPNGSHIIETANGRAEIVVFGADASTRVQASCDGLSPLVLALA